MTTLAHGSALQGPRNGGVSARRAVVRWAWRMFRREWRQQILVTALLAVAGLLAAVTSGVLRRRARAGQDTPARESAPAPSAVS